MSLEKEILEVQGYENVIKFTDPDSGLLSIIAIQSTVLGPSIGGTRIQPYACFNDGLEDVLRLSKGMSFKTSFLDGRSGGAKSIIFYDPAKGVPEAILRSFAEAINLLEGSYYCAEDVGCFQNELKIIQKYTPYIVGVEVEGSSGNPSAFTALSTLRSIDAALEFVNGSSDLRGKTVALQGVGQVGTILAQMLFFRGANLVVCDINKGATEKMQKQFGARVVGVDEIYAVDAEIFCPCALGATLNSQTIPKLNCKCVVGSANNQLLDDEDAVRLFNRGILYAPDFVVNCGGLVNVQTELRACGYCPRVARDEIMKTYDRLLHVFQLAQKQNTDTNSIACQIANERMAELATRDFAEFVVHHSPKELV